MHFRIASSSRNKLYPTTFSFPQTHLPNNTSERASRRWIFQKVRGTSRPSPADRAGTLRSARAGIRDPMTLMTRLCVRILTLTGLTARKARGRRRRRGGRGGRGGGREGDERRPEVAMPEPGVSCGTACGGNKRLLEASSARRRGGGRGVVRGRRFRAAEMIYLTTNNIPP